MAQYFHVFGTIAEAQMTTLPAGVLVKTKGGLVAGDGLGAEYITGPDGVIDPEAPQSIQIKAAGSTTARSLSDRFADVANVKDFGAVGDGVKDDRLSIQAAIDYAESIGGAKVYIPSGTYMLSVTPYTDMNGVVFGIHSIQLKDNITLEGDGNSTVLKTIANSYGAGAFYRMISSERTDGNRLLNVDIKNLTLDGNRANQTASEQCSNMLLECANNIKVLNVNSINANGQGIQIRGENSSIANAAQRVNISDCYVNNCSYIGIQVAHFRALVISNNNVTNCVNNGIDVYGDDGDSDTLGRYFTISGNTVTNCLTGIFPETVQDGAITGNSLNENTGFGVVVNRINGQPNGLVISGNAITSSPVGILASGDSGGVLIEGNSIDNYTEAGVKLGQGNTGNVSYYSISNNLFTPSSNTVATILGQAATLSFCVGQNNTINSQGIVESLKFFNTSTTTVNTRIHSFTVIPQQVGSAADLFNPSIERENLAGDSFLNIAVGQTVVIDDNTGGIVYYTARQSAFENGFYEQPYIKRGGTLVLGTLVETVDGGNPMAASTVAAGNLVLNPKAGNTYINTSIKSAPISG